MGRNGSICAVAICPSPKGQVYHVFPKDLKLQKVWIDACKRKDKINVKFARVCSLHFQESDYERDFQSELLNLPIKKRLKAGSYPTLKLLPGEHQTLTIFVIFVRMKSLKIKR